VVFSPKPAVSGFSPPGVSSTFEQVSGIFPDAVQKEKTYVQLPLSKKND
jgi:hypothetical protein